MFILKNKEKRQEKGLDSPAGLLTPPSLVSSPNLISSPFPLQFRSLSGESFVGEVEGFAVLWGDQALVPNYRSEQFFVKETFKQNSFDFDEKVFLNVQHNRNKGLSVYPGDLELDQTDKGLHLRSKLPNTTDGRDTAELLKRGVLSGLSVEFYAKDTEFKRAENLLVVNKALLTGVGIVDKSAYPKSKVSLQ